MTTETNHKLRAVFLAAIMFLWLFAGTVALAGSATAQFNEEGEDAGADRAWDSGSTGWQGQQLYFQASTNNDGDNLYRVREHDGGATYGDTLATFELGPGNSAVIDSSEFEGPYVITRDGNVVETDSQGTEVGPAGSADNHDIDFAVQNLNMDFVQDQVGLNDNATLDVGSNRAQFNLTVESDNLTQSELESAFQYASESERVGGSVTTDGDDAIVISGVQRNANIDVNFDEADFDEGEDVTFDFDVADSTAADSASISVSAAPEDVASFGQSQYSEERGDVVTFDIDAEDVNTVNVSIGSEDINYEADLEVSPNDDGEIVIEMNTWLASRTDNIAGADTSDVFTATEGSIENATESTTERNRVLDVGLYDLVLEETTDDPEPVEYDVAVIDLNEPSLDQMAVHTHPNQGFSGISGTGDLYEARDQGLVTESEEIAIAQERDNPRGDGIVVAVEASGIHGLLAANTTSEAEAEGLNFTLEQLNPGPNEDPAMFEGFSDFDTVIVDSENDTLFLLIDSDNLDGALDSGNATIGDEYETTFELTEAYLNQFLRSQDEVDEGEEVNGTFSLVDREAEFNTEEVEGEDVVLIPAEEGAEISGASTVAPGTNMQIRTRATGESPFLMTERVEVEEDGTFSAEFDFSGVSEGQEFEVSIQRQSFDDNALTQGVVGEVDDETPTPTPEDDDGEVSPTPTPEDDDGEESPSPEPEDEDDDETEDQPGFGAVVALVSLLAAALLAARRRSFDN